MSSQPLPSLPPSGSNSTAAWFLWISPSITDLLFLVIFFALTCGVLAPRLLWDAGIGWHIRNGQHMLETHTITRVDSFSSTMSGHPWYAWEWLYDGVIAAVHGAMGLNGVEFFSALVIAATFTLVLRLALRRGASLLTATALLMLSIAACSIHLLARPHLLSWLVGVVWFQIVDSAAQSEGRKRRRLYWLPALMLLWVNVHGGFVFGLIVLVLYMAGGWIQYFSSGDSNHRQRIAELHRQLGIVAVVSFLATFVNPYGYKLHQHIYAYLSDRFLMNHIDEFLSPNFHHLPQQGFAILLLVTILALAISSRKPTVAQLLVVLFAVSSGLYASRNLPLSSLLLVLLVAPLLSETFAATGERTDIAPWLRALFQTMNSFGGRMEKMELSFRGHLWPVAGVVLCLWICLHGGMLRSSQLMDARFDAARFPVQATEVISARAGEGPIFCPDTWGGYLIYELYPKARVVVDDRHDLYGTEFFKDYLKVVQIQAGWAAVLDNNHVTRILIPARSSLAILLRQTPQWIVVHDDDTAVFFRKLDAEPR